MFAVGLGKHHQLNIGWVASKCREGIHQIGHFLSGQGQAELLVRDRQRIKSATEQINPYHRRGRLRNGQLRNLCLIKEHRFGHAVVHERQYRGLLFGAEVGFLFEANLPLRDAFHPGDLNAAVVGNIGGLRRPSGYRAHTGCDPPSPSVGRGFEVNDDAVCGLQKGRECGALRRRRLGGKDRHMHRLRR